MALVSPGVQLTVTDEAQYASNAIGTVPLVVLATAQDKTYNGSLATGTTKANAGKLQVFTSQRDLLTALGAPSFKQSAAGTPIYGDERNEYGLMAAYSALGLGNQLYAIRADIDLNELTPTDVRPTGAMPDSTVWLDLADTTWGIYEWSESTQTFTNKTPIVITDSSNLTTSTVTLSNGVSASSTGRYTPLSTVGQIGNYAVVAYADNAGVADNRIWLKAGAYLPMTDSKYNTWVLVGSKEWQDSIPVMMAAGAKTSVGSTTVDPVIFNGATYTISGETTIADVATQISDLLGVDGLSAGNIDGKLAIYVNGTANSGALMIEDTATSASRSLFVQAGMVTEAEWNTWVNNGITPDTVSPTLPSGTTYSIGAPTIQFSNYAGVPNWNSNLASQQPTGAVWFKQGALGGGSNLVFKQYNATTNTWTTKTVTLADSEASAIDSMDTAGGKNIANLALWVDTDPNTIGYISDFDGLLTDGLSLAGFKPYHRTLTGPLAITGTTPAFTSTGTFTMIVSEPGTNLWSSYTITLGAATSAGFVAGVSAAAIPNVRADLNSDGTITLNHSAGGTIIMQKVGSVNIPYQAGFHSTISGVRSFNGDDSTSVARILSGFSELDYVFSVNTPTQDPYNGEVWAYGNPTIADVMINDGTRWRGYRSGGVGIIDARGYDLGQTDPAGIIVSASKPLQQSGGGAVQPGDLWLNTSDLENWPALSRYNGSTWIAIDNTDQISVNGIVFADARWDASGTHDPATDAVTSIATLLSSDYLDLDAPDARLYPRGTLLFNTRRSGFNVKRFVTNYFNDTAFAVDSYDNTMTYSAGSKVLYGTVIYVAIASTTGNIPTNTTYWKPLKTNAWVTAVGLRSDGSPYTGHHAQRQLVVEAMNAALESNTQIREDQFSFQLICAPGYPETITQMVALNNDRANTAFVIGDTPLDLSTNLVDLTNWSTNANGNGLATNDPYLAVYWPSALSTDLSGNTIMVPPSHMVLRTYLRNDNVSYPWFAPAGLRRGIVDNAIDLGYTNYQTGEFTRTGVRQALRDGLYNRGINPITILPGTGIVVWGQKTRDPITESMDRVNVSRLVNYIRTGLARATDGFLFEPNDKITRDQAAAVVSNFLNDLVGKRALYDYVVVCDTTNNTPSVIQNNELYIDVAIAPTKAVEFIYIPIRLVNPTTGASGA